MLASASCFSSFSLSDIWSFSMKDFTTLSPIPGFMTWLLSKLASQLKLSQEVTTYVLGSSTQSVGSAFREYILLPVEERQRVEVFG